MGVDGAGFVLPRPSARSWPPRWMASVVFGLLAASIGAAAWTASRTGSSVEIESGPGPSPGGSEGPADDPGRYYTLDGGSPQAYPATRLAIGFLALDGSLRRAVEEFGPASSVSPDIGGQASAWTLPGAELSVSTWYDDQDRISGLMVRVPDGSRARFAIYGDVALGSATLRQIVDGWGESYTASTSIYDDFVVQYVECVGPYPIVIKFDQDRTDGPRWDEKVTSALIAYADEAPNTAGCQGATTDEPVRPK